MDVVETLEVVRLAGLLDSKVHSAQPRRGRGCRLEGDQHPAPGATRPPSPNSGIVDNCETCDVSQLAANLYLLLDQLFVPPAPCKTRL